MIADVAKHLKLESGPVRSSIKILVRDGYLATKTIKGLAEPTLSMGQRYHVQKFVEIRLGKKRITK